MSDSSNDVPRDQARTAEDFAAEIEEKARAGEFIEAEKLRDRLMQEHPMAISQIVTTAGIIEEQKEAFLDHDHIAGWDSFYGQLSQEEKNHVFYSTRPARVAAGKLLFAQGKNNNRLFFIDSGRVTLFHTKGNDRHLLGQLSRGDIVGDESFLEISISTCAAGCQTDVTLRYLEKAVMRSWDENFPGLRQKLADYCLNHCRMKEMVQAKNLEKRVHPRQPVEGRVTAYILGPDKSRTKHYFRGSLHDISRSGMNFAIRCSKSETAQALLGRYLDLEFEDDRSGGKGGAYRGRIVRVSFHLHNDYSIHLKLDQMLTEDELKGLK